MKQCEHCGALLEESAGVCPDCGQEATRELQQELPEQGEAVLPEGEGSSQEPSIEEQTGPEQEAAAEEEAKSDTEAPSKEAEDAPTQQSEEEAASSGRKHAPGKVALAVIAFVVLAALLAGVLLRGTKLDVIAALRARAATREAMGTVPPDGNPEDETCKGSYTASDKKVIKAADTVVAVAGDYELTNAQLQIYYWLEVQNWLASYGNYASYFGLDYTKPLDTQPCAIMEGRTWQQYFLTTAVHAWQRYQALAAAGLEAGYQMDPDMQDYLASLPEQMLMEAQAGGFQDADDLMRYNVGPGATVSDYQSFMELYYRGIGYFNQEFETFTATDEEIAAMFDAHEEEYASQGLTKESKTVNVRHILIMPQGADSANIRTETFPQEAWDWAETKAQELMDQFLAGDLSEDSFAQLAKDHSMDGSAANGGLYTGVEVGQMVSNFNDWCFDSERKVGDYGLVKTEFGYHLMFYSGEDLLWLAACESDVLNEKADNFITQATDSIPMTVFFDKIKLGFVDLAS